MTASAFHILLHIVQLSLQVIILFLIIMYTRFIRKRDKRFRP